MTLEEHEKNITQERASLDEQRFAIKEECARKNHSSSRWFSAPNSITGDAPSVVLCVLIMAEALDGSCGGGKQWNGSLLFLDGIYSSNS